jgi:hypothetical protein
MGIERIEEELDKVPKSDSNITWNATALAILKAQVTAVMDTLVPASPTAGSLNDILSKAAGANTFDKATDSLEAISEAIAALAALLPTQTLSAANDTVTAGFYAQTTLHAVDADLAVGNIATGKTIFGFAGTYDTEAGNPVAAGEMKTGQIAFVNGSKVTGSGTVTLNAANDTVSAGYYEATDLHTVDADLATANIKSGVTIFGIAGTYDTEAANPVAAGEMKTGQIAFVNGSKVTGSGTVTLNAANDTVSAGYYEATDLLTVDADITREEAEMLIGMGKEISVLPEPEPATAAKIVPEPEPDISAHIPDQPAAPPRRASSGSKKPTPAAGFPGSPA